MFSSVYDIRKRSLPPNDPLVGMAIFNKALVYSEMNDSKHADAAFNDCLNIFRTEKTRCLPNLEQALDCYASFLARNGQLSRSVEIRKELAKVISED